MDPEALRTQAERKQDESSSHQKTIDDLTAQMDKTRLKVEQYRGEMEKIQTRLDDARRRALQASDEAAKLRQQAADAQGQLDKQRAAEAAAAIMDAEQNRQAA